MHLGTRGAGTPYWSLHASSLSMVGALNLARDTIPVRFRCAVRAGEISGHFRCRRRTINVSGSFDHIHVPRGF